MLPFLLNRPLAPWSTLLWSDNQPQAMVDRIDVFLYKIRYLRYQQGSLGLLLTRSLNVNRVPHIPRPFLRPTTSRKILQGSVPKACTDSLDRTHLVGCVMSFVHTVRQDYYQEHSVTSSSGPVFRMRFRMKSSFGNRNLFSNWSRPLFWLCWPQHPPCSQQALCKTKSSCLCISDCLPGVTV